MVVIGILIVVVSVVGAVLLVGALVSMIRSY